MVKIYIGWDYSSGAANDPNAPWNQEDPPEECECPVCGKCNVDLETGDALCEEAFPYCSKQCELDDESNRKREMDDLDWNDKL